MSEQAFALYTFGAFIALFILPHLWWSASEQVRLQAIRVRKGRAGR